MTTKPYTNSRFTIPDNDRLPAFAHDVADKARAMRQAWLDRETHAMEALHLHQRADDEYRATIAAAAAKGTAVEKVKDLREQRAADHQRAADIAHAAKNAAAAAYVELVELLRTDPEATTSAADAACEDAADRIREAEAAKAQAAEDLRQALPARRWVSSVLQPRGANYTLGVWQCLPAGASPRPEADALDKLRAEEAKRQRMHDAQHNPPPPPANRTGVKVW